MYIVKRLTLLSLIISSLNTYAKNSNPLCKNLTDYRDNELYHYLQTAKSETSKTINLYNIWDEGVSHLEKIKAELKKDKPLILNDGVLSLVSLTKILSVRLINLLALAPGKAGKSIAAAQGTVLKVIDQYQGKSSSNKTLQQAYKKVKPLGRLNSNNKLILEIFNSTANLIHGLETLNNDIADLKSYKSELVNQVNKIEKQITKAKAKRDSYKWTYESINAYQNWIVEYCATTQI